MIDFHIHLNWLQLVGWIYVIGVVLVYLFFLLTGGCGSPEGCIGPLFISLTWFIWAIGLTWDKLFYRRPKRDPWY